MKFRTEYVAAGGAVTLNPEKPVLLLGSCFADNMAERMLFCQWTALNPFGVLYNPLSIARAVSLAVCNADRSVTAEKRSDTCCQHPLPISNSDQVIAESIFEHEGVCHSWLFDSKKSHADRLSVVKAIDECLRDFRQAIVEAEALFITFGTAWCYFLAEKPDYVVANCHKQPARLFNRRRINIDEITDVWVPLLEKLHNLNPELKVIFTVSPVRHLKDGFEGNARSKATLLLAVEKICDSLNFCHYFPAYEIMNDDLRDYRFYAADLNHPSAQGADYIWEKLKETYLDADGIARLKAGEQATRRAQHRTLIN